MHKLRRGLLPRLFAVYLAALFVGFLLLTAKNIWVHSMGFNDLKQFFFGAIAGFLLIFLLAMQAFTLIRLRSVYRGDGLPDPKTAADIAFASLVRFPSELFRFMIVMSVIFSTLYHWMEFLFYEDFAAMPRREAWIQTAGSFLAEQALAVTLAVMVYSLLRIAIRPFMQRLGRTAVSDLPMRASLIAPLRISLVGIFVVIAFDVFRIVLKAAGDRQEIDIAALSSIVTADIFFGMFVLGLLVWDWRKDLNAMLSGIRSLAAGERSALHDPIPIGFPDEIGELAEAFNAEQERIASRYERMDRELALARDVQQMLLSERERRFGPYRVSAERPQRGAEEQWFDIAELRGGGFAVTVAGALGVHGMPAVLAMATGLFMMRAELARGGSAAEILIRLQERLEQALPGELGIHAGLALFDPAGGSAQVAATGRIELTIGRNGRIEPLGDHEVKLHKGERLIIRAGTADGGEGERRRVGQGETGTTAQVLCEQEVSLRIAKG